MAKVVGHMRCFTELRSKVTREACHDFNHLLNVGIGAELVRSDVRQDVDEAICTPIDHGKGRPVGKLFLANCLDREVSRDPIE